MATSQAAIVRAFSFGKGSVVVTIPKQFSVQPDTRFLVDIDGDGRVTYTPLNLLNQNPKEKAKAS